MEYALCPLPAHAEYIKSGMPVPQLRLRGLILLSNETYYWTYTMSCSTRILNLI